jgi:type IV pilus assembly protein PilN
MIKINLLPHKKVKAVEKGVLQLRIVAFAITALVVVGLLYGFIKIHATNSELKEKNNLTSQQLAALKKKVKDVEGFEQTRKDLEQKLTVIQELQKRRVPMSVILSELNKQTTRDVWFTSLHIGGITFELTGMVRDSRSNAEAFFKKLEGADIFYDLNLEDVKEDTAGEAMTKEGTVSGGKKENTVSGGRMFAFKISGKLKGYEQPAPQAAPQDTQLKGKAEPKAAPPVLKGKAAPKAVPTGKTGK